LLERACQNADTARRRIQGIVMGNRLPPSWIGAALLLLPLWSGAAQLCDNAEGCAIALEFPSGGSIDTTVGARLQFSAGGELRLGEGGTLALGEGGSVVPAPAQGATPDMSAGGEIVLGSGGAIHFGSGGALQSGEGGQFETWPDSELRVRSAQSVQVVGAAGVHLGRLQSRRIELRAAQIEQRSPGLPFHFESEVEAAVLQVEAGATLSFESVTADQYAFEASGASGGSGSGSGGSSGCSGGAGSITISNGSYDEPDSTGCSQGGEITPGTVPGDATISEQPAVSETDSGSFSANPQPEASAVIVTPGGGGSLRLLPLGVLALLSVLAARRRLRPSA